MSRANRASTAWLGIKMLMVVLIVVGLLTSGLGEKALCAVKAFAAPKDDPPHIRKGDAVLVGYPPALQNPTGR